MVKIAMFPGTRTIRAGFAVIVAALALGCESRPTGGSHDVMPPEAAGVTLGMSRRQVTARPQVHDNSGDLIEHRDSASITYWFGDQVSGYRGTDDLAAVVVSYRHSDSSSARVVMLTDKWARMAGPPILTQTKAVRSVTGAMIPTKMVVWRHEGTQLALYQELQADPGTHPPIQQLNIIVAKSGVPLSSLFAAFGEISART
jgi:hypothetical protein